VLVLLDVVDCDPVGHAVIVFEARVLVKLDVPVDDAVTRILAVVDFVGTGEREYVEDPVDVFVRDMDPVFVGEAEELRERKAVLVDVIHTIGDPVCLADLVKLPVDVDVLEGGALLDKLGEAEEVRVPIEVRVEQGDADWVEDPREDPVIVLLDVPVLEDVVEDVVVFEERPDTVACGEADEVFVIGPVRVFATVP